MAIWTPPSHVTSGPSSSSQFNEETVDNLLYLFNSFGAWADYTPTLSSAGSGSDWALGNGGLSGNWREVAGIAFVHLTFQIGSSTTKGTKFLCLGMPKTANSQNDLFLLDVDLFDASAAAYYRGSVQPVSSSSVSIAAQAANGTYVNNALVTSTIPFTWDTGDIVRVRGWYKVA